MYDYLSSKIVWIIAAIVMTSSMMGIFMWQRESTEELELEISARGIKDTVNEFCTTDGEIRAEFTFNKTASSDFNLEPTIKEDTYTLNFTSAGLFLTQDGKRVWNRFIEDVYLFNPSLLDGTASIGVLEKISIDNYFLTIPSYQDFVIETKEFNDIYNVFIYIETSDNIQNETKRIKQSMEEVSNWTMEKPENKMNLTLKENTTFKSDYFYIDAETITPVNTDNLYLWKPVSNSTTRGDLTNLSMEHSELYCQVGENITMETKLMDIQENYTVLTYLYKY
ncbi:MAG: hypothetical protein ACOC53_03890 [Candidatus Saliniplasma sp.]